MEHHSPLIARGVISSIALGILLNLTSPQESTDGTSNNKINIYGTITLSTMAPAQANAVPGERIAVDNISIGRMYQNIPVYRKPATADTRPDIHTSYLDLLEIAAIAPTRAQGKPIIETFAGREYITITVTLNDTQRTMQQYIIERTRKIYCNQISQAGPIKNELLFEGIEQLELNGYKQREAETEVKCVTSNSLNDAQQLINEIEQTSEKLQTTEPGQLEQLATQMNNLIKKLKDSLYSVFSLY